MTIMMSFLISLTVVGIIPLTTVLVAGFLAKRYHYTAYHAACICGLFMLSEFIALAVGISFKSVWVNLAMLVLSIVAYCVLFVASRSIPQVVARNIVGFLMLTPVICALLASPLLIFAGSELLLDVLDPGHDIVRINERYECRTKEGHGLVAPTTPFTFTDTGNCCHLSNTKSQRNGPTTRHQCKPIATTSCKLIWRRIQRKQEI